MQDNLLVGFLGLALFGVGFFAYLGWTRFYEEQRLYRALESQHFKMRNDLIEQINHKNETDVWARQILYQRIDDLTKKLYPQKEQKKTDVATPGPKIPPPKSTFATEGIEYPPTFKRKGDKNVI